MFPVRVVFTLINIILVIIVTIIIINDDDFWISFFCICKDKNDSPLYHWRKDQAHFCNSYKFGIKDICECIKVLNFFYKLVGTVSYKIKLNYCLLWLAFCFESFFTSLSSSLTKLIEMVFSRIRIEDINDFIVTWPINFCRWECDQLI